MHKRIPTSDKETKRDFDFITIMPARKKITINYMMILIFLFNQ